MTDGILLPGWDCTNASCGVFNGSAKKELAVCRCCGAPRPSALELAFKRLQRDHEQALKNLTSVQERCTELVVENRELRHKLELSTSTLIDISEHEIWLQGRESAMHALNLIDPSWRQKAKVRA